VDTVARWGPFERIEGGAPPGLRTWLVEPGLLTDRIRALCGDRMRFRMLGPLRDARLAQDLQSRLGLDDERCLLREIEFRCGDERVVYAQTVLPGSTLQAWPWLRELGDSPLGESLRRAGDALQREPLEYAVLPPASALALAAVRDATSATAHAPSTLWARRAVYRLGARPILVQEVFLPALLQVAGEAASASLPRRRN
jgi:chorismate--pyruvate lyase